MLITLPDGSSRFFEVHSYPVKDSTGAVVQAIEHGRDISTRKSLEKQLKTSEEKYRTIVELAREGIFIVDTEDKLTFVNNFLAGMLGLDSGEVIGHSVYDFMGEDARELVKAQLERRRQGLSDSYELTLRREDSSSLISLVSAAPLMVNGGFLGSIGIATDITYLKNVEKELRGANEFREKIIHGITDNLLVIDPHTYRIVQANNSFLGRVGLESQAVLGRTCFDVMLHRDRPCEDEDIDCPVLESARQKKSSLSDKIYPDARGSWPPPTRTSNRR